MLYRCDHAHSIVPCCPALLECRRRPTVQQSPKTLYPIYLDSLGCISAVRPRTLDYHIWIDREQFFLAEGTFMSNRSFVVLEFTLHATTRRRFRKVRVSPCSQAMCLHDAMP